MVSRKTQTLERLTRTINRHLDTFARTSAVFKDMTDACTYKTSSIAPLLAKANYCISLRDQTWIAANKIIADIKNDARPVPDKVEAVLSELPVPVWP